MLCEYPEGRGSDSGGAGKRDGERCSAERLNALREPNSAAAKETQPSRRTSTSTPAAGEEALVAGGRGTATPWGVCSWANDTSSAPLRSATLFADRSPEAAPAKADVSAAAWERAERRTSPPREASKNAETAASTKTTTIRGKAWPEAETKLKRLLESEPKTNERTRSNTQGAASETSGTSTSSAANSSDSKMSLSASASGASASTSRASWGEPS